MADSNHLLSPGFLPLTDDALQVLASVLEGLRYGKIEIMVHDGRIVQIERSEKIRFDKKA